MVFRLRVFISKVVFSGFYSLQAYWCRWFRRPKTFGFRGKRYRYFYHPYNFTHRNERAVEVPIILEILRQFQGKKVLEVGNCLSHYVPVAHEIVDKYEVAPGVINQDVVEFTPSKTYDLIFSISTLEHVGLDEEEKDPEKPLRVVRRLVSLLRPGGRLVVTLPLGVNPSLDRMLERARLGLTRVGCLRRLVPANVWKEVGWEEIRGAGYGWEYQSAIGMVIGEIER